VQLTGSSTHGDRSVAGGWWISGLLFLATMINYMDRQTLSNLIPRITEEWSLSNEQYGDMEFVFGVAFAVGSLVFGFAADKVSVRWLYPAVLVAWSAVGFATGLTRGYESMLVCRGLLGFFESGHWPCALIVTQAVMSKSDRVMGNSILQSGASAGAVLTPLVIRLMVGDTTEPDAWRMPFFVIGAIGLVWAVAWIRLVPAGLLPRGGRQPSKAVPGDASDQDAGVSAASSPAASTTDDPDTTSDSLLRWFGRLLVDRRFWGLIVMVIMINTSWQLVRAWLPTFLQKGRGYDEAEALYFNSVYFIFTDVGCIAAGAAALALARRGMAVHTSRVLVFFACSLLAALTTVAAMLPAGWLLLGTLLAVAAGTLGVFPCYYSFTQELTVSHMGRVTGVLSFVGWLASAPVQKLFGRIADATGSYDINMAILGWAPLAGLIAFVILWPRDHTAGTSQVGVDTERHQSRA
jgi:ACS family hexuronate transporter-like MFS transporter